jgi:hypothetical protein
MLPTGNQAKLILLVTKPQPSTDRNSIKTETGNQKLYFTNIEFDEFIYSEKQLEKILQQINY